MNRFFSTAIFIAVAGVLSADAWIFTRDKVLYQTIDDNTATVTGCDASLVDVVIPATVDYDGRTYEVVSIAARAFASSSIQTLTAAESVVEVGRQAFFLASSLREVYLPGLTTLGEGAFYLSGVGKVVFGDKLTVIPKDAFDSCKSKLEVDLSHVKTIGSTAFRKCVMDNVEIGDGMTLEKGAFQECQISSMTITGTVNLPSGTFVFDRGKIGELTLVDVDFSSNGDAVNPTVEKLVILQKDRTVMNIGGVPSRSSAKSIYLDADTETLEPLHGTSVSPFSNSSGLQTVVMGPLVKLMYNNMFYKCPKLETVSMSASVTEVENAAFADCNAIKTVECMAAVPPVCSPGAFTSTVYGGAVLKVPEGCRDAYAAAAGWSLFSSVEGSLSGIGSVEAGDDCIVRVAGGRILFYCPDGTHVAVYGADGRLVYEGRPCAVAPGRGVYIVRVGRHAVRVAV